ncbi:MAG: CPXCG motif-containing cysteine-rich protein [Sandaracinaceae bacterium]|nr:CPXCG motif-containing cysteine-rich protein [Sandaracinaceae bacterium]
MTDTAEVQCPWCFELLELYLDPETEGTFVQDCDVCCRPYQVTVWRDESGEVLVEVSRAG